MTFDFERPTAPPVVVEELDARSVTKHMEMTRRCLCFIAENNIKSNKSFSGIHNGVDNQVLKSLNAEVELDVSIGWPISPAH